MRTSNKILAGTFIAILLIITGIHLGLYAKYKSNDFVTMKYLHEERFDSYPLKGIESVSLSGLQNVTIIPSDTARVEIEKNGDRILVHDFASGVLTIKGDTTITNNNGMAERIRSWRNVIIYLPLHQDIKSDDCEITIKGGLDSLKAPSVSASMNETTLHVGFGQRSDNISGNYFNKLSITKYSHGNFDMSEYAVVRDISMDLTSSGFEDNNASFGSITVNADSSSTVKLNGRNIAKTKFTLK